MGGPGTVCLMESLIARKAKKFLLYGNCGVLRKDIAAGHLILPTAAPRIPIQTVVRIEELIYRDAAELAGRHGGGAFHIHGNAAVRFPLWARKPS